MAPGGLLLVRRGRSRGPGRSALLGGLGVTHGGRTHAADGFRELKSRGSRLQEKQRHGLEGHDAPARHAPRGPEHSLAGDPGLGVKWWGDRVLERSLTCGCDL